MSNTSPNHPTLFNRIEGLRPRLAEVLADWRRRAGIRRAEQRLKAELASMSAHERIDLDVMSGNHASSGFVPRS